MFCIQSCDECAPHVFVLILARDQAKLRRSQPVMATTHDAQSLSAIAANSAAASRVLVHEMLGRSDVQVSCVCLCFLKSCVCLCDVVACMFATRMIGVWCKVRWSCGTVRPRDAEDAAPIHMAFGGRGCPGGLRSATPMSQCGAARRALAEGLEKQMECQS